MPRRAYAGLAIASPRSAYAHFNFRLQGERMEPQDQERIVGRTSKWASLAAQVAKLKDGESIVLEPESDPTDDACLTQQACKIRSALNGIRVSRTVRRAVQVVNGKIVITRMGSWPMLSAFKYTTTQMPNRK
jgi:hypothetical protein